MRLITIILIVAVCSISAQNNFSIQDKVPGYSIATINNVVCQANNYKQFEQLKVIVKSFNQLKKVRSEGRLLKADYIKAVETLINDFKGTIKNKCVVEYAKNDIE